MSFQNNTADQPCLTNRPNGEILRTLLAWEGLSPISTTIHLDWNCGLRRVEIPLVRWIQLDLVKLELVLLDRTVPLPEETAVYLRTLAEETVNNSAYVLVSRRGISPMSEENVSMLTRRASLRNLVLAALCFVGL